MTDRKARIKTLEVSRNEIARAALNAYHRGDHKEANRLNKQYDRVSDQLAALIYG